MAEVYKRDALRYTLHRTQMANPPGPTLARPSGREPLPEVREQPAGEKAAPPPGPPSDASGPVKSRIKPWPTMETPLIQTNGAGPVLITPTDEWEEPPDLPVLSNGIYSEDGDLLDAEPAAYDWEETARTPEPGTGMDLADSSPLFPVRRPLYKRSEPPPSASEQLESVIEFLRRLQKNIVQVAPPTEEPSPTALGSTLLQLRRLSRSGVVPDPFEIGVLPKPPKIEAVPPVEAAPRPAVEATPAPEEALPPTEPPPPGRRHGMSLILIGGLCLVTLASVAYVWMHVVPLLPVSTAPRGPVARGTPGPAPEQEISEEALKLANLVLEAMQQGDFKRASDVLAQAQKQAVTLPGLYYQAALLAFNQGKSMEADNFLEQSIRANEAVPDCWYLRANTLFYTEGGPAQAAEAFEQAVAAAPFNPRSYFFRAECLRRNGNAAAAVTQFQQALRCRPNSTDTELILFKIGLTKIESNTDVIFKTELHDRLAQEPVSGDTLLLAAADAISRNEFAEAAGFFKRAALVLPPRIFQARVRDYVFQAQVKQPDIAGVLKLTLSAAAPSQPAPRSGRVLVDPATRSLAEADPAGW